MVSVKGTPCRSSSGAPSIWYFTSCRPFCRCSRRASHCGGTSGGSGWGISRLLPAGSIGTGASSSPSSSRTSASGGGANRGGLLQTHALVGQPPLFVGWLLVGLATTPPWKYQKTCFDEEGQLQGP
ncbi:UNVERIFIED_CONTAM: hypothetical protein Slati_3102800 [Sesamum latifolium]|uniref:Uncharacterized protein n=1 Tax=Sesamum latifolium TaxID=2727402 RepID=A0AAW2UUH1_9LAMI